MVKDVYAWMGTQELMAFVKLQSSLTLQLTAKQIQS